MFQCNACRHQTSLIAGAIFRGTRFRLTVWFLAICLISQAKTGLWALAFKRQLGVSYRTAWLIEHKLMHAKDAREERYSKARFRSMMPTSAASVAAAGPLAAPRTKSLSWAAVSLSDEGHPLRVKLSPVPGFTLKAIAAWASTNLAVGSTLCSHGLACFSAVTEAGCVHQATVVAGRKPKDLPEFEWINTVLGNLKTSLSGSYHAFNFRKYAARYLAAFTYRLNRRFDLRALHQRLLVAPTRCSPQPEGHDSDG